MKKNLLLILILGIFMVFAGCSDTTGDSNTRSSGWNYNGGDKALQVEFTDGQPPSKIRDGGLQPFNIRMFVENIGESDIPAGAGHVALSGINPEDYGLSDSSQDLPELRGVKLQGSNIIPGSTQPVMFSNLKFLPELTSGILDKQIFVDVCYPYKTEASVSLCVSGNTLQSYDEDLRVCELDGDRQFGNSGAPIGIDNVKQNPAGTSSVQLQFDIIHTKAETTSRVYRKGSFDTNCRIGGNQVSSVEAGLAENYVQFTVKAGNLPVDCNDGSSTGEVFLSDSRAVVFCTIDTTGEEDYESTISVELDYDYFDRHKLEFQVEHIER